MFLLEKIQDVPTAQATANNSACFEFTISAFGSNENTSCPINFAIIDEKWIKGPTRPMGIPKKFDYI